jgi:hypothetical protein
LQAHYQISPSTDQSFAKWSEAEFVNTYKINYIVNKELAKPTKEKLFLIPIAIGTDPSKK